MCSYFIVGSRTFRFFKKSVFAFLEEWGHFKGGVKFSKILREVAHNKNLEFLSGT